MGPVSYLHERHAWDLSHRSFKTQHGTSYFFLQYYEVQRFLDVYGTSPKGIFFPMGVRVFPAGILQIPQEILTKTLIIEQILGGIFENINKIFPQNREKINMFINIQLCKVF